MKKESKKSDYYRLSTVFADMKKRCYNPEINNFHDYGGRGIKICDEWLLDYFKFKQWAIENGYSKGLTIDRIDNDGHYEPNNCRWSTRKEQQNNKRNNVLLTYQGQTLTASQWSEKIGGTPCLVQVRLFRGWSLERAITTPLMANQHGPKSKFSIKK